MKPIAGVRREDWLAAVEEALKPPPSEPGVLTVREFGEVCGLSRAMAQRRIHLLLAGNLAELTEKIIQRGHGLVRVPAYRLVQPIPAKGDAHATRTRRRR